MGPTQLTRVCRLLKKKFFVSDVNIDRSDPVQLHLLYIQCRETIGIPLCGYES
jgi:hypothetical protein